MARRFFCLRSGPLPDKPIGPEVPPGFCARIIFLCPSFLAGLSILPDLFLENIWQPFSDDLPRFSGLSIRAIIPPGSHPARGSQFRAPKLLSIAASVPPSFPLCPQEIRL